MTAMEHFKQLVTAYVPQIKPDDRDADGDLTDEALARIVDWAWDQMTKAEHVEYRARERELQVQEIVIDQVARGRIVIIPGEDTYYCANEYGKHEKVTAEIDALVAAGSHYRGQDDPETGGPRFFAIPQTASEAPWR